MSSVKVSPSNLSHHLTHCAYRPDIDGLRAVAVLSVLIFHAFPHALRGGFVGVDIFFVISGFLISTIIFNNLKNDSFSFWEFYSRRIRRIFPSLITVLLFCFAFGWAGLLGDEFKQLGKHITAGAGFISNFALWGESGYFDNVAETKPLLHLWSLGIEEQFYIGWPLLVWAFMRRRMAVPLLLAVVFSISFIWNVVGIHHDLTATFYAPYTRFWELLVGAALAWCNVQKISVSCFCPRWKPEHIKNGASVLGLILLICGIFLMSKKSLFPGWWALIPTLGAVLMISAGQASVFNRLILSNRSFVWFGLISFPLYLWHWPLLAFARIVEGQTPSVSVRGVALLLSVFLAWLTFRFIEKPLRFGGHARRKAFALIMAMVLIFLGGVAVYQAEGLPLRSSIRTFKQNQNELQRTPAQDEACLTYVSNKKPTFDYCRFADQKSPRTIAVMGDSHAHVGYPGIERLATETGQNTVLLANSGCPPFLGGAYGKNETEVKTCHQKIDDLVNVLISKSDIKQVFIFSRGPVYLTGTYFGEAEKGENKGPLIDEKTYLASLQRTIDALRRAGKEVYYVTENPELPIPPEACIPRPLRFSTRGCDQDLSVVLERQKQYTTMLGKLHDLTIINTLDAFCEAGRCHAFHDGELLYADFDHVSVTGSHFLAQRLLKPYITKN